MTSTNNFIDQTFSIIASGILQIIPASNLDRKAFTSYRDGLNAQSAGQYATALSHYIRSLRLETDVYDRSYILYNIGLIHAANGKHARALEYYYQALERNPLMPQALNNIAVIYHYQGEQALEQGDTQLSKNFFSKAREYWKQAIRLSPLSYNEAYNWVSLTENENMLD